MKFIHLADTHFSNSLQYNRTDHVTGISLRFKEQLSLFKDIIDFATENDIEYILHGGDFYDRPNPTDLERTEVERVLEYIKEKERRLIVVAGNHDIVDQYSSISDKFNHYSTFLTSPTILDIGLKIVCVPWCPNQERYMKDGDILLIHASFAGSRGSNNYVFRDGTSIPDKYEYIAAGHHHAFQQIGKGFYPGSLLRMNFGEKDNKNYFIIWDDGKLKKAEITSRKIFDWNENGIDLDAVENNIIRVSVDDPQKVLGVKKKLLDLNPLWLNVRSVVSRREDRHLTPVERAELRALDKDSDLIKNFLIYCNTYNYSDNVVAEGKKLIASCQDAGGA